MALKIIYLKLFSKARQFNVNITPYQEQDRDDFIKERIKTQVGLYTYDARKTQEVVLSEQFRKFYYNCVVNQKVVFNYGKTGKTEAELQAILNRVLATNKWISTDGYQIMYFSFSFCYARQVLLFRHIWFVIFECYITLGLCMFLHSSSQS